MKICRDLEVFVNSCQQCKDLHFLLFVIYLQSCFHYSSAKQERNHRIWLYKQQHLMLQDQYRNFCCSPSITGFWILNVFAKKNKKIKKCVCGGREVGTWLAKAIPHFSPISSDFVDIQHYVNNFWEVCSGVLVNF